MFVVEQAKKLVLKLRRPERVLSAVPTARVREFRGNPVVLVPHNLDETRVLRNLGIDAPPPILHYYDWPGRFKPYQHQMQTAAFLTMHQRGLVLNEIGTGKTQSALWAADYLMSVGAVKRALILSPLSTLERVWGDAVFMNFPHRSFAVLHGTAERRRKLLATDVDFYICNHDGFPIIAPHARGRFDLVIVDEAAVLRNPGTRRYKAFRKWLDSNPGTRLWLMTGTPTPNEPTDAWALASLVGNPNCGRTQSAFRDRVMHRIAQYRWVPRPNAADIVSEVLQPAVRYTRDECFDLPETVFQTRQVSLTADQKKHFQAMMRTLVADVTDKGTITAVNEAVKMQKLVQIACGVAYADDGSHVDLDCAPRVAATEEVIEEAGGKAIVFVPLTGTLRMLEQALAKRWSVGVVNGEVSATERNRIFHAFQHTDEVQVLLAHPGTMAHGLTLTAAKVIVWYGPVNSNEVYVQANGRVERIGKRHAASVVHIAATDLELQMYERLKNKQRLQGVLLDMISQQTRSDG